ncbi:phenylacetic acid degradation protein [Roseivivax halodurans JCM 10272]|uniref:Phenylacetic acid degradation protein n=1 Tax=Roseivivax halodurans JCM 10272 TaxID=1449350 RepID=X7EKC6_9RHOB|nr:1,2-phenylacetyl-CoA epoxidase subunit PaaC [Roseivivax halodurans]ETX16357.1 phenylacetic acid degradation protein [Roseivivax halodurans JCM 10272]
MPSLPDMTTPNVAELARDQGGQGPRDVLAETPELKPALFEWLCRMGDSTLVLGHRLSEWCGRGPALEEDIAVANVALDLIGHTQMWLGLAAEVEEGGRSVDDLAYLRDVMRFRNIKLAELPNGDIGRTLMRQFLFDAWHHLMLERLVQSSVTEVAEIAAKALKEVTYHLGRSSDLVIRLGDGTAESHARMQEALDLLWPYTGEMFTGDAVDETVAEAGVAPRPEDLRAAWTALVTEVLFEATLSVPENGDVHRGGKQGRHTEHLGYLLAEMQFLQRAYPGAEW